MVKSKLIMKKKPMNAMEAYRKKEKNKERLKNKKDKGYHRDNRNKEEEKQQHHQQQQKPTYASGYGNEEDEGFDGEEDLLEFNSAIVQQKLQEKQRLRELRFDDPATKNSINDLAQMFTKKTTPAPVSQQQRPISNTPSNVQAQSNANYQSEAPSSISSFMSDNIFRSQNIGQQSSTNQQIPSKTGVGDKRLQQKREGAGGPVDPFMMTTMQGNYDPTARNKNKPTEDPMLGNYSSQAPGVYKPIEKPKQQPVNTGPVTIVKEAALTSAPFRSQMEREKSSLIPMNVVKKKPVKPAEEAPKTNQSTMNIGIMNVTNVPAPQTNFGFSQSIQQNAAQKDQLSAFLQEISQLEDG